MSRWGDRRSLSASLGDGRRTASGTVVGESARSRPRLLPWSRKRKEGPEEGSIQIAGQNALQPGDSLRIWIDTATLMMRRVENDTALEEKPVRVEVTYQNIPGGPTYQARAELAYPDKELEAIVENLDYEGGASATQ